MKIQPYIEKLNGSKEYKDFNQKYPNAFLVAGFFVLDLEMGQNLHQVDYYLPKEKKVAAFTLDDKIVLQLMEMMKKDKVPEKLDINTEIDLDALEGILEDEMKNRGISEEIKKIIAVLQTVNGKKIWNLNCILSGMGILKAHVEDKSKTVLKMEKISMIDIVKHMPTGKSLDVPTMPGSEEGEQQKNAESKIEKLDKLKAQIEKEEEKLKKSLKSSKNKK